MKLILNLILLTLLSSCFQQSNSNTSDQRLENGTTVTGNEKFQAAFNVLNNECVACHTGYHDDWLNLKTEEDWASLGDVKPGDSNNSHMVERIHGCGTKDLDDQMPKSADRLNSTECGAITDWIDSL